MNDPADRCFDPDPAQRSVARDLYTRVADLPLVCPHGHVDPRLFAEDAQLGTPADLFIIPDHYVFRMLYSQGIPLEALGVPSGRAPQWRPTTARSGRSSQIIFICTAARLPATGLPRSCARSLGWLSDCVAKTLSRSTIWWLTGCLSGVQAAGAL